MGLLFLEKMKQELKQGKVRILHIIKSLGRGGAEMLLPETLKLHNKEKFDFHYIYFLPWKNQLVEALELAGGKVSCFQASNNILILLQYRKIIRYIKQEQIDIVHCHLPWAGFVGRIVHRLNSVPTVYTEHNKQERYHGVTFFLNKRTFNWQNEVIAVSEDVHESIQKNIAPQIPVSTILNGVNTATFVRDHLVGKKMRDDLGIPQHALVVGTVAVFRFQKRLIEWLEVAKKVIDKDPSIYFIIVGDGPLKNEIEAKRKELAIEGNVILAGLQTEVKPWLSAMDIYMMTSIFEGLPIALLEAMSMQCAIVTTDAGGIKEVIRDNADGLMTGTDDWMLLSEKIEILKDADVRKKFGEAARKRVEESFSLKVMVNALEEKYRSLS